MVIYAILIKLAFVGVVFYYYFVNAALVDMPFRILAGVDFIFAILFIESLRFIKK